MATSPVLYVYYPPLNDDAYPGIPARHITEADWAGFTIAQRRTIENATTQEGYTRRKVWVHRDLVDETEEERAQREAAEAAARAEFDRKNSLVRYGQIETMIDQLEVLPPAEEFAALRQDVEAVADVPDQVAALKQASAIPEPGRTFSIVGDLHVGGSAHSDLVERLNTAFADLATLDGLHRHRLYVGDVVDRPGTGASGTTPGANDTAALARITALDPVRSRWSMVPGNHDMMGRSGDQAAAVYGEAGKNWVKDLGFCRVIAVAPDNITDHPAQHQTLSAATVTWLDQQLRSSSKDAIILSHGPLARTSAGGYSSFVATYHTHPNDALLAVLDRHHHARAWVCGHTHSPLDSLDVFTRHWTGSRYIAHVNAGSIAYTNPGVTSAQDPVQSLYMTLLDDRIEVRVRDHREQTWAPIRSVSVTELRRVAPLPDTGNPTSFVFPLTGSLEGETRLGTVSLQTAGNPTWATVAGRQGLRLDQNTHRVWLDPRDHLEVSQGSLVIRAIIGPATGTQYLAYHKTAAGDRLYLQRGYAPGTANHQAVSATMGGAYFASGGTVEDNAVVTIGLNWAGGRMEVFQNGEYRGVGTFADLTTWMDRLYLGSGDANGTQINGTLLGVAGFHRPLTPLEHLRLAFARDPWSMVTVADPAPVIRTAVDNPTAFVLPFNGSLTGETKTGTITATSTQPVVWRTTGGRQGAEVVPGLSPAQCITVDPSALLSPARGAVAIRCALTDIEGNIIGQYLFGAKTPEGDRVYVQRGSNPAQTSAYHRLAVTMGASFVNVGSSRPIDDGEIITVGLDWDGATVRLFLDGALVGSSAYTGLNAIATAWGIGSYFDGGAPINNAVYGFAGFTRPLLASEHARLASATAPWTMQTVTP